MAYETITVEKKGKVGLITLNRPDALNALNTQLNAEMGKALDKFEADKKIGCVDQQFFVFVIGLQSITHHSAPSSARPFSISARRKRSKARP